MYIYPHSYLHMQGVWYTSYVTPNLCALLGGLRQTHHRHRQTSGNNDISDNDDDGEEEGTIGW